MAWYSYTFTFGVDWQKWSMAKDSEIAHRSHLRRNEEAVENTLFWSQKSSSGSQDHTDLKTMDQQLIVLTNIMLWAAAEKQPSLLSIQTYMRKKLNKNNLPPDSIP